MSTTQIIQGPARTIAGPSGVQNVQVDQSVSYASASTQLSRSILPAVPNTNASSTAPREAPKRESTAGAELSGELPVVSEIIVLKFGGSVLQRPSDVDRVVDEVYRWVRRGHKVVCVVSALEGQTDALLAKARSFGEDACPTSTALLLSTGELQSAALLGLALRKSGVHSEVVPVSAIRLRCLGDALDAELASVDINALQRLIDQHGVIVVPGFTGVGTHGQWHTLGRGGSDLTALFLASQLGATCRLIKDVQGLYEWDPQLPIERAPQQRAPRRFKSLHIDQALALGGEIVQDKALRFVRQHLQQFTVSSLGAQSSTHVTPHVREPIFDDQSTINSHAPLKVALLGFGTVGLGVASHLLARGSQFAITGVLVRNLTKARDYAEELGLDAEVITTDWRQAIDDADIVIEALGGCEPARLIVTEAILSGKHIISANKSLIADWGQSLRDLALLRGVQLRYSAAVGGAAPVLETAQRLKDRSSQGGNALRSIAGILNGTTNFVLQRTLGQSGQGLSRAEAFGHAVRAAQELGFAEADPSRDLDGLDLEDKLIVLAQQASGLVLSRADIARKPLNPEAIDAELARCPTGWTVRYIAELSLPAATDEGQTPSATIGLRPVPLDHPLANVLGAANAAIFAADGQAPVLVRGQGAGRWPTARAVLADVLEVSASLVGR